MADISVIIPAYNRAEFLQEALNSVLNQSLSVREIIVVDDGSTDNTAEVVTDFDEPVQYFPQDNAGAGAARNAGLAQAVGRYVAFLDSDDWWQPEHLEALHDACEKDSMVGLAYCGKQTVDSKGGALHDEYQQTTFPSGWIFANLFSANYISSTSCVFGRREVLLAAGGFPTARVFRNAEDYDLWLRVAAAHPIAGLPTTTVVYRRHEGNLTRDGVHRVIGILHAVENASALIKLGQVSTQNRPDRIDVASRRRQVHQRYVRACYYDRHWAELWRAGKLMVANGFSSPKLIAQWVCSWPSVLAGRLGGK